jgi:hypothetical protein
LPNPKATVARTASQVPMMMRAKPKIDTKPKLRCPSAQPFIVPADVSRCAD